MSVQLIQACCCIAPAYYLQGYVCSSDSPSNVWFSPDDIDTTKIYKIGTVCYRFPDPPEPGPLPTGYRIITEPGLPHGTSCEACCEFCTGATPPSSVTIDTAFSACASCSPGEEPEWDGVLYGGSFVGLRCEYSAGGDNPSIGGKFSSVVVITLSWLCGLWSVGIRCYEFVEEEDDPTSHDVWIGVMAGDKSDPTGTYTRILGCDTTPTRNIS
jgi:hypothetical protein